MPQHRKLVEASVEVWQRLRAAGLSDAAITEALAPLSRAIATLQPPERVVPALVDGEDVRADNVVRVVPLRRAR